MLYLTGMHFLVIDILFFYVHNLYVERIIFYAFKNNKYYYSYGNFSLDLNDEMCILFPNLFYAILFHEKIDIIPSCSMIHYLSLLYRCIVLTPIVVVFCVFYIEIFVEGLRIRDISIIGLKIPFLVWITKNFRIFQVLCSSIIILMIMLIWS